MHIVRSILGVFVAAVVAIILIMIGHMVNTLINLPAGLNLMDQDAIMAHYKEHGPTTPMLIGVLVTYAVAAFVAGFLAALIAGWAPRGHALPPSFAASATETPEHQALLARIRLGTAFAKRRTLLTHA